MRTDDKSLTGKLVVKSQEQKCTPYELSGQKVSKRVRKWEKYADYVGNTSVKNILSPESANV